MAKEATCTLCAKVFTKPSNLRVHMLVHSGEKPHGCEQCGKTFSLAGELKKHKRIHSLLTLTVTSVQMQAI